MPLRDPALAADEAGDDVPGNDEAGDAVDVCWVSLDPPPPQANEANAQRAIKTNGAYFISENPLHRMMVRHRGSLCHAGSAWLCRGRRRGVRPLGYNYALPRPRGWSGSQPYACFVGLRVGRLKATGARVARGPPPEPDRWRHIGRPRAMSESRRPSADAEKAQAVCALYALTPTAILS